MRIGVNLLNFGTWAAEPAQLGRWARQCEEAGFHFLMISDHIAVTPDVASRYPAPFYDPFAVLAYLCGQVSTMELGTTVTIVPYRHPLQTARLVANIDQLSGGRFIFGVGIGWAKQEFAALGLPFERRGAMTDEYLDAIVQLWTNEVSSFDGRFCSFADVDSRPLPARSPPIWVGGASDAALRRTVRLGGAWHPVRPRIEDLRSDGLPRLARIADELGEPCPTFAPRIKLHLTDGTWPGDPDRRVAGQGSADQIRADLAALEELGATHVLLDTYTDDPQNCGTNDEQWQMLERVAAEIVDLASGAWR